MATKKPKLPKKTKKPKPVVSDGNSFARVYSYGAEKPIDQVEFVDEQMKLAQKYYNALIANHRDARKKREVILEKNPGYAKAKANKRRLEDEIKETIERIKAEKQAASNNAYTPELSDKKQSLKAELKEADVVYWKARRAALRIPALQAEREQIEQQRVVNEKAERAKCGVFFGSYLVVEGAVGAATSSGQAKGKKDKNGQAKGKKAKDKNGRYRKRGCPEPELPKFKVGTGEGHLAVEVKQGLSPSDLFDDSENLVCKIEPVAEDTYTRIDPKTGRVDRRNRRANQRTVAKIRLGSHDGGKPIWVTVPIYLHRPLPESTPSANGDEKVLIKRIHLIRERVGPNFRWKVQFTLESRSLLDVHAPAGEGGVVTDVGWRPREGKKIRVAYWHDTQGNHGEYVLPEKLVERFDKIESLQSIRDQYRDRIKKILSHWLQCGVVELPDDLIERFRRTAKIHHNVHITKMLDGYKRKAQKGGDPPELPGWWAERAKFVHAWRAQRKFAALCTFWAQNRFEGDELIFLTLHAWVLDDRHLWSWIENLRDQTIRRRNEEYKKLGALWANTYTESLIEEFDLSHLAEKPDPDEEDNQTKRNRHDRHMVAISHLRSAIVAAFHTRRKLVQQRDAAFTTQECYECGVTYPRGAALIQKCAGCGKEWDQDYNACRILLRSLRGGPEAVKAIPIDPPKKGRAAWILAKEAKQQRLLAQSDGEPVSP